MTTHQASFSARRRPAPGFLAKVALMGAFMSACSGGEGPASLHEYRGGPLQLVFSGGVQANDGASLEATVSYASAAGARVVVARDSIVISTGGSDATMRLSANATGCFRDAVSGNGTSCTMDVALVLRRDGRLLDDSTQQVVITQGTTRVDVPALQLFEVATIRIAPAMVTDFEPGDSRTFTAVGLDRSGLPVAGRAAVWQIGSGGISVGAAGEVRAVTPGPASIRAQLGGRSAELRFDVRTSTVAALTLSPADTLIAVGLQAAYRVVARAGNSEVLTGRAVTFTSTNAAVATVSASGVVTGMAPGQSTITVRSTEGRAGAIVTASAVVRVEALPVIAVTPSEVSFQTEVGQPLPAALALSVRNGGGGTLGTLSIVGTVPEVSATLDRNTEPATLTVRPLQALAGGAALTRLVRVHSSVPGVADALVSVTLTGRVTPVATVSITPGSVSLVVGGTSQLTAVARDAAGNVLTGRPVVWTSSAQNVAMVGSATGLVTATGVGTVTITATVEGRSATVPVAVTLVPVATVSVTLAAATILPGQSTQATAVTRDASGTLLTGRGVSWSSSNTSVAMVNASTGVVSGGVSGTANIIATSEGRTGLATVTVAAVPVANVTVSISPTSLVIGQTVQAVATTTDAAGNVLTGRTVTWSTSSTGGPVATVATVNPATGLVTAVAAGFVSIIATSEGRTGFVTLSISAVPVASVTVSLGTTLISVGQTTQATAVTRDASGAVLVGRTVVFASSNTTIATVNPSTGLVTAVAAPPTGGPGTVTISATSEGRTGLVTLTVTLAPRPVATVTVTVPDTVLLVQGKPTLATAVLRDSTGTVLTGRVISWSSSNAAVATVSASGLVTPFAAGTARITSTSEGRSGTVTIFVVSP